MAVIIDLNVVLLVNHMMHMCFISQWVVLVSCVGMIRDGGNKSTKAGVVATVYKSGIENIVQKQGDLGDD